MNLHDSANILRTGAPLESARALIVLVHGRGSSGHDMIGLAEHLAGSSPTNGVAWIAPSATNGTWYPQRFLAPLEANEPWLGSAQEVVHAQVTAGLAAGIPRERIGLIGFSQGACLVLEYAARQPARYGFVAGLSGALIGPLNLPRPSVDLAGTPILLGCADHDAHIPIDHVEQSATWLDQQGATVTKQVYPGSAHTVFPPEIAWLQAAIRGLPSG